MEIECASKENNPLTADLLAQLVKMHKTCSVLIHSCMADEISIATIIVSADSLKTGKSKNYFDVVIATTAII